MPHRANTYVVTDEGIRVSVFYTKLKGRQLGPLLESDQPPAPFPIRRALATIEHGLEGYVAMPDSDGSLKLSQDPQIGIPRRARRHSAATPAARRHSGIRLKISRLTNFAGFRRSGSVSKRIDMTLLAPIGGMSRACHRVPLRRARSQLQELRTGG